MATFRIVATFDLDVTDENAAKAFVAAQQRAMLQNARTQGIPVVVNGGTEDDLIEQHASNPLMWASMATLQVLQAGAFTVAGFATLSDLQIAPTET